MKNMMKTSLILFVVCVLLLAFVSCGSQDNAVSESVVPESVVPDSTVPESTVPESTVPDNEDIISASFSVTVNKFDNLNYSIALTEYMIEDSDTGVLTPGKPVARLDSKAAEEIRDMDGETLPAMIDNFDGEHNGENYIAYSYYLVNNGEKTLAYEYNLYIVNTTNGIEKGVRVRLYEDGVPTTYARTATDGSGPEPGTVEFIGETTIVRKQVGNFRPSDYTRFTVVIWLEGPDPDTTDDIFGGQFKVDMKINIVGDESGDPIEFEQED